VNVAFYAPLKPPDHPTPSGDRAVARMLLRALRAGGHRVTLASRLRSLDRHGDPRAQARIRARGARLATGLVARLAAQPASQRPDVWFTYHLYHKAPDWLGPPVSRALGIPYLVAEASHAPKQAGGPWDEGYRAAAAALACAARVVVLNPADEPCVRRLLGSAAALDRLAPFIDARASARRARAPGAGRPLHAALGIPEGVPLLVTVAMMRPGAKLASYRLLADALGRLQDRAWSLLIIGDGPAAAEVRAALRPLATRVHFAGQVPPAELPGWLAGCDLHLWPAVDEAWGMAFLEAAAAGVPSVAGREGGVASVVAHGRTGVLVPPRDSGAFAAATAALLEDPAHRALLAGAAAKCVLTHHDLAAASRALGRILTTAVSPVAAVRAAACP
jgi:glycosyltransferase involved in cell wall biosynthesis